MAIVSTEVEVDMPGNAQTPRMVWYRCQDSEGQWHSYGPVCTTDPAFDKEAYKTMVATAVADNLAAREFEQLLGD